MKILHILSQRPEQTGSGIYITQMMRQAHAAGHENALIAGVPSGYCHPDDPTCCETYFVRFGTETSGGLPHHVAGMSDVMPYPSVRFRDFNDAQLDAYERCFAGTMREAVAAFSPDIIHVNHLWIAASLVRRLFSEIPVVASCHGSDIRQFRQNPHLQERVLAGCSSLDAVCTLHEWQKQEVCELYQLASQRVSVTGAGYDETVFRATKKSPPYPVRLCYAGKLSRSKGVPWLLQAMERLPEDVVLDMCGSGAGDEYTAIRRQAERLGQRVVLHGNVSPQALASIMQRAHVFVLPSMYEGLPLVMLEALACGCRLVSTRLPGVEEAFGRLDAAMLQMVPLPRMNGIDDPVAEDEPLFVDSIVSALDTMVRQCRNGEDTVESTSRRAVLQAYSWRSVFERVDAVYKTLK